MIGLNNDKSVFQVEYKITENLVDNAGRIKLSCLLYLHQITCEKHTDVFGLPGSVIRDTLGLAFVFTKIKVNIKNLPLLDQTVVVKTWCSELKGVRFTRNFLVTRQDTGELLTECKTEITVIDLKTRKLVRPGMVPEFSVFLYNDAEQNGCDYPQKLLLPSEFDMVFERKITEKDIDVNHHVNNTVYADMLTQGMGDDYLKINPTAFEINYDHEVLPYETIKIGITSDETSSTVVGNVEERHCFTAKITYN